MLPVSVLREENKRANTTLRSAAGLLTLVENRHPFAGFPSSVEKAVDGSVLAVLRGRPWLFHGASASIGHRSLRAVVEEGGAGGGGKNGFTFSGDAAGCPTIDDRDLGRPDGRPSFEVTRLPLGDLGPLRVHALRG